MYNYYKEPYNAEIDTFKANYLWLIAKATVKPFSSKFPFGIAAPECYVFNYSGGSRIRMTSHYP